MSLIDQALKKTQSSLQQNHAQNSASAETHEPIENTASNPNTPPLFARRDARFALPSIHPQWIIAGVLFVGACFCGYALITHFHPVEKRYSTFYKNTWTSLTASLHQHSKLKKLTTPISDAPLVVNGIMEMNKDRVALINGKLYHPGEMVNGYNIVSIHYNRVTLENPNTMQIRTITPSLTQ